MPKEYLVQSAGTLRAVQRVACDAHGAAHRALDSEQLQSECNGWQAKDVYRPYTFSLALQMHAQPMASRAVSVAGS